MHLSTDACLCLVISVFIFGSSRHQIASATKEVVPDDIESLTRRIWLAIEKRLEKHAGDEYKLSTLDELDNFSTRNSTIIKAEESLKDGAVFLNFSLVDSQQACQLNCIKNPDCNMAVFKDSSKHACYLFNCGNPSLCEFSTHPHYESMSLPNRKVDPLTAKHEQDLVGLAATPTSATTEPTETTTPTTTTTTTTMTTTTTSPTTTTTATTTSAKPIMLTADLFDLCDDHTVCSGHNQVCLSQYCVCKPGYQAMDDVCKLPPASTHSSDESSEAESKPDESTHKKHRVVPPKTAGVSEKSSETKTASADVKEDVKTGSTETKAESDSQGEDAASSAQGTDGSSSSSSGSSGSSGSSKNKDPEQSGREETAPKPVAGKKGEEEKPSGEKTSSVPADEKATGGKEEEEGVAVRIPAALKVSVEEEAAAAAGVPSNRGAVIALAMGLSITALLLLFVGCRLRSVKRRLRRGRPLTSNEADYLINGMYL